MISIKQNGTLLKLKFPKRKMCLIACNCELSYEWNSHLLEYSIRQKEEDELQSSNMNHIYAQFCK